MKRRLAVIFGVLVVMAIFASTVFAAPAQAGKNATLTGIDYQSGGIVLSFQTSGLSKNDLKNNSFFAHSNYHNMYCNFIDDSTDVRCVVSKKLAQYAGEGFHVTLAGFGFWGEFPANTYCSDEETVWITIEIVDNGEYVGTGDVPLELWNEALADGLLEYFAELGITFEITDQFCGPADYAV